MEPDTDTSRMTREIHPMPEDVKDVLRKRDLLDAYNRRPPYQQNDYLGWIARAKRADTRQKRLDQMLDELEDGGVYMNMEWNGPA